MDKEDNKIKIREYKYNDMTYLSYVMTTRTFFVANDISKRYFKYNNFKRECFKREERKIKKGNQNSYEFGEYVSER